MRRWKIAYPDEYDNPVIEILTDDDIIAQYWNHWYDRMCKKFGKEVVDSNYTKEDCIYDWTVVHWAWEVK